MARNYVQPRMASMRRSGIRSAALFGAALWACALGVLAPTQLAAAEDDPPPPAAKAEDDYLLREPWWAFLEAKYTRKEVRDLLVAWVGPGIQPGSGALPTVQAWIEILDGMLLEDETHKAPKRPLAELTPEKRIAELIFRLRDIRGSGVFANGGPPSVFAVPAVDELTAADLLVAEGHAAIPALIATLGDERLTRCAGAPRGGRNPMVWRVGDVALKILTRIAGRPFPYPPKSKPTRDFGAIFRPVLQEWWDSVQEKGEFLATADEMQATTVPHMDVHLAKHLVTLNPNAASALVVRVARKCTDPIRRKLLIDVVGPLTGPGTVEFLRRELQEGEFLLHRVAAAYWLRDRGEGERATKAIRSVWRGPLDFGSHPHGQWARWTVRAGIHQTAAFLATSEDATVVADLGVDIAKRPAPVRAVIAQMLGGGVVEYQLMGYFGTYRHLNGVSGIDNTLARELLRPLLDDNDDIGPHTHPWGGPRDMRVADMAAAALAKREPGAFKFEPKAKLSVRDTAIDVMRTTLDTPLTGD